MKRFITIISTLVVIFLAAYILMRLHIFSMPGAQVVENAAGTDGIVILAVLAFAISALSLAFHFLFLAKINKK